MVKRKKKHKIHSKKLKGKQEDVSSDEDQDAVEVLVYQDEEVIPPDEEERVDVEEAAVVDESAELGVEDLYDDSADSEADAESSLDVTFLGFKEHEIGDEVAEESKSTTSSRSSESEAVDSDVLPRRSMRNKPSRKIFTYDEFGGNPVLEEVT